MYQNLNPESQSVYSTNYQTERASIPRTLFFFIGAILLIVGITLLMYNYESPKNLLGEVKEDIYIKLREGEGFLRQNTKESAKQALQVFNHVLASNVNLDINQKAKYGIAAALEILEENSSALEYYRELQGQKIKDKNVRDKVNFALGRFYLFLNHESEGRALLEPLLAKSQNRKLRSKILTAFGGYYLKSGEYKRAEDNFRVALKYDNENLKAEEGRAQALKGQGQDWGAYRLYDDYLFSTAHLNPENRNKVINKVEYETFNSGIQALRNKRYPYAIDFFRKVSNAQDKNMEEDARYWTGEAYYNLNQKDKAIKAYESVLKNSTSTKDAAALFKIGMILFQKSKLNAAAKVFKEITNNYPESKYSDKAKEYLEDIHQENEERFRSEDESNYVVPKAKIERNPDAELLYQTEEPRTYQIPPSDMDETPKSYNENYNQELNSENFSPRERERQKEMSEDDLPSSMNENGDSENESN